ncbi:MAG: ribosomal RNA small subunit methyltransferase A [Spirochaetaceae bacterium]|nr:ribosomal RNA small subunit methyltransferase A [Spirochaetaceae bacterium]
MDFPDYDSPAQLKIFLEERNMAMQKKFGQNFLINAHARTRLIDALDLEANMSVWEVGPGLGAMTDEMLKRGGKVTAFEIDRGFCGILKDIFKGRQLTLVEGDVLKTWKKELALNGMPARFFGNLPYNVGSVIIADMISGDCRFEKAVVTVQKEVAMRMCAKPGSEDYSSFSVLCQWAYEVTPLLDLSGGSFWPRPNVDSRAVKMVKKSDFPRCKSPEHFMALLRALFVSRRKTIKNNLNSFYKDTSLAESVLEKAAINPQVRAETLDLDTLLHLSEVSYELSLNKEK